LNFIFSIVCLFECVCAFSLRRESPDMILGDKPLIFEVVLSQLATFVIGPSHPPAAYDNNDDEEEANDEEETKDDE
jgi:hypothetical protein